MFKFNLHGHVFVLGKPVSVFDVFCYLSFLCSVQRCYEHFDDFPTLSFFWLYVYCVYCLTRLPAFFGMASTTHHKLKPQLKMHQ